MQFNAAQRTLRWKETALTGGADGRVELLSLLDVDVSERRSEADSVLEVRQRCPGTVEQQANGRRVALCERRRVLATSDGQTQKQSKSKVRLHYTLCLEKRTNFETVQLEIMKIDFDEIWQKY